MEKLLSSLIAVCRIHGAGLPHDSVQTLIYIRSADSFSRQARNRNPVQTLVISAVNILSGIRSRCREKGHSAVVQELIQNKSECVDVYRIVIGTPSEDLGRHIGNRSDAGHHPRNVYGIHSLRGAEISRFVVAEPVHEQIGRFDVPMNNSPFLTINQCCTDVPAEFEYLRNGEQFTLLPPLR